MRLSISVCLLFILADPLAAQTRPPLLLERGESLALPADEVEANDRAVTAVALGNDGRVWAATSGVRAQIYSVDPRNGNFREHIAGFDPALGMGLGFAHGIAINRDGSAVWAYQRDITGLTTRFNEKWIGHMQQYWDKDGLGGTNGVRAKAPEGQGVYTLAALPGTEEVVGLTWPDGHFFYQTGQRELIDHGPIAGYRTYETPRYADKINQGTDRKLAYSRQVSRAIAVDPASGAYTAGEGGAIFRYDPAAKKFSKLAVRLPAAAGRESFASLDAACVLPAAGNRKHASIFGGTSDGYLFELRILGGDKYELSSWGKPFAEPGIWGLVAREDMGDDGRSTVTVDGLAGWEGGITRAFRAVRGPDRFELITGGPPLVDGAASMEPFSNLVMDVDGNVYGGERDRIGRLVKFSAAAPAKKAAAKKAPPAPLADEAAAKDALAAAKPLSCRIVFAPDGTTTEASGYTALEVGGDGQVYVGSARYGDYGYLLRFPGTSLLGKAGQPAELPTFMEKAVYLRELTGEHRDGLNTQGKIHAKILAAKDGRIWFATKQAHEVFGTRPEYEDASGYPGGHLCVYDPATKQARTLGILKPREGLMGGALDEERGKLYFRSEPKNHFLAYDIKTGVTRDLGNLGSACRYLPIDKNGCVYTFGRGQTICRYHPETQLVEEWPIRVEGGGEYVEPYVVLLGPDNKLYGLRGGHPTIMRFEIDGIDPAPKKPFGRKQEVVMWNIAPATPDGLPALDIHAAVFGADGKLYWPLVTAEPALAAKRDARVLTIMRFDPATGRSELVGKPEIQGLDEDKVRHTYIREDKYALDHMQGAAIGPDGTLYLMDIYPQLNVACFPGLTAGPK